VVSSPCIVVAAATTTSLFRSTTRDASTDTTVIQLCATASIVGASAVGLSFGRECPLDASSNKRKAAPAGELDRTSMPTQVRTATRSTTTASSYTGSIPLAAPSRAPFANHISQDGRPQRRIGEETASVDPSVQANGGSEVQVEELELAATRARRPSWIKRLSAISISQSSSRDTSPGRPLSTSVSCSNGSMAFSHDGSTAPIIGDRLPLRMPPNKLVKRSSSVHTHSAREAPSHGTASRLPSFRRPATSHQRSATLQHQSALLERMVEDPPAPLPETLPHRISDSEVEYTRFFTSKIGTDEILSKRKSSWQNIKGLRRIYSDGIRTPTLLLAKSVSAGARADDIEDSSQDGESVFFMSRPDTPLSIAAAVITQNEAPRQRANTVDDSTVRPRRSFSITDFLSPRLARRASRKRASVTPPLPMPTMARRRSNTAHGEPAAATVGQNLSDHSFVQRRISTSGGPPPSRNARHGLSPPVLGIRPSSMHAQPPASANTNHTTSPPILAVTAARPSRYSMAPSEQASTLVGSDNEARGMGTGDEEDADVQSETVYDSLRTGATRSTTGARGPRIETIFDESPPSKVKVTALRDLLPKGTFREQTADAAPGHHSIEEEDETITTPVRTIVPDHPSLHNSPSLPRGLSAPLFPSLIPSSPPDMPKSLSLGRLEWDSRTGDDDNTSSRWSIEDDDDEDSWAELPAHPSVARVATPVLLGRHNLRLLASAPGPYPTTPPLQHLPLEHGDRDARSSIFDWSEQQHTDKSSGNRTPPRPSTVHGKKDADRRGSRSVGRRVPSGLHARSQSVPVVPDATSKRNTVVTNKFGTWGVGSKGVTEDWNDDFEFPDLGDVPGSTQSQRVDSGTIMIVPKTIQEQQSNVLANIGLLREWGLLIEELKEQRVRAAALDILHGPYSGTWEEVDAMIDLADQEAEHEGISRLSPPSSPAFDEDTFDDVSGSSPNPSREVRKSGSASDVLGRNINGNYAVPQHKRARRKSILRSHHQIFGPHSSPMPPKSRYTSPAPPEGTKRIVNRPRKDSEAKARSVIEALQKRKSTPDPFIDIQAAESTKKVPFDTATLRRIVPYVNSLTRKVKDTLREAEGLYSSPSTTPPREDEPPFKKMFHTADNDLSTQMKLMTVM
jgi:hypothetical protein